MHEMALTQGIIEICEKYAEGKKVSLVEVEIGELSGVVADAVRFCFEACCLGTLLENAMLEIVETAGIGCCLDCKTETRMKTIFDPCSACGGYSISITAGEDMRVLSVEVEDED